jgi:putative transposase
MKKSRFSEEQIIRVLKQHEAGVKTADLCREHGTSAPTFYAWKSKYGGLEVSEAQRLKSVEDENRRFQHLACTDIDPAYAAMMDSGWTFSFDCGSG